jgi:lysophospholipase L1-like esterase
MKRLSFLAALFLATTLHAQVKIPTQTETDKRLPAKGGSWSLREAVVKDASLPRILLIGDSITNGYLEPVRKALEGKANIDAWITPTSQADKSLGSTLEAILSQHDYAVVHFNLGLHGWQPGRIPAGQFESLTRLMVQNLRKYAPKAKLIWATITPVTVKGEPEKLNPEIQPTIEQHNAMALKVMQEEGVAIDDLGSLMLQHLPLAAGDMFHWKKEGMVFIVNAVTASLTASLPH